MDGYEAIGIIKKDRGLVGIPVVVLTASAMKEEEKNVKAMNCQGFVRKPVKKNKLLKELTRHLAFTDMETEAAEKGVKTKAGKDTSAKITPEIRKKLPELVSILDGKIKNKWEGVTQKFIISDIQDFATGMEELGKKYNMEVIVDWTKDILTQADCFDMEKLPKTLKYFPKIVEKIKKMI
jgi:two-component system sensor histidine kinase EvgS